MGDPNGILVTIEGWGVNLAGCYGNSLLPTPNIDRLSAHGIVYDQFWMHSVELEPNLRAILRYMNPESWLVATDSREAGEVFRGRAGFEHLEVSYGEDREGFEYLLTEALESWLQQRHETPFLWVHSKGLCGPWDAPYEYRKLMCDEDDPEPPSDKSPPDLFLSDDYDPDTLFGFACGAGGQSVCIDLGVGFIQQTLKELGIDQTCWISLAGLLGFPLGEHRRVGLGGRDRSKDALGSNGQDAYSERLHTPWILKPAPEFKLGTRVDFLMQPCDLGRWIERMTDEKQSRAFYSVKRELPVAWAKGADEIAVLTERWSARFETVQSAEGGVTISDDVAPQIFCFPEDRWQQNEIASRVPEVHALMRRIATILLREDSLDFPSEPLGQLLSDLSAIRR